MKQETESRQGQRCPQCSNHCPANAPRCGKGRKYFGLEDKKKDKKRGRKRSGSLCRQLHRCGRFAKRAEVEDDILFQALTGEEKAVLQELLDKLTASWQVQFGKDALKGKHQREHHKHKDHKK